MINKRTGGVGFSLLLFVGLTFLFGTLFAVSYQAPALAQQERITPVSMVYLSYRPLLFYAAFAVGGLVWFVIGERRLIVLYAAVLSVGVALLHVGLITSTRDARFLKLFADRVVNEVGPNTLSAFFDQMQNEIKERERGDFDIDRSEIPKELQAMYSRYQPDVRMFFLDEQLYYIQIYWGGPLYRWGIEIKQGLPAYGGFRHVLNRQITSNAVCFISPD